MTTEIATTTETAAPKKRGRPRKAAPSTAAVDLPAVEASILPRRSEAENNLRLLSEAELATQEDADLFGALLKEVRAGKDALEIERRKITDPLHQAKTAVDALFRPMRDLLDAQDRLIVKRLGEYMQTTREAQSTALAAVATGSRDADTLATAHTVASAPEGFAEIPTYTVEIVSLEQVPRQFMAVNEDLVIEYAKHCKKEGRPLPEIPGLKIVEGVSLRRVGGK